MKSQVREKDIESYLVKRIKDIGGKAYKFVSPGNTGVPDRLVCLPENTIAFVELKAPGKHPTELQLKKQRELINLGCLVLVTDSKDGIDDFIDYCEVLIRAKKLRS